MPHLIGVDLGGTYIKAHAFRPDGKWLAEEEVPTPADGPAPVTAAIGRVAAELRDRLDDGEILAIGVGVPGTLSSDGRRVRFAPNLAWHDVPLAEMLEQECSCPVFLENDGNLAALGENWQGAGVGIDDLLCVTVGTGIGGGILLGGRLWTGPDHNAAEIGHMIVQMNEGLPCACGRRGCWEQYASTLALVRRIRQALEERPPRHPDDPGGILCRDGNTVIEGRQIIAAARAGDPLARRELEAMVEYLAVGLTSLTMILNPRKILLVGGILAASDLIIPPLRQRLVSRLPAASREHLSIEAGRLGNRAGSYGAACLALRAVSHG